MTFELFINQLIEIVFFPPGINLILFIFAYYFFNKFRKFSLFLFAISFLSLLFLSLPIISNGLINSLENLRPLTQQQVNDLSKQKRLDIAIVVLSGGRISLAPEYGEIDTVNSSTLQRIQYASWLQQKTKLPLLLSGGSQFNEATPEAVLMNQTMLSSFNISPKWIEFKSKNMAQKAQNSAKILYENSIREILLVTHAIEMQRAKIEFEKVGLKVIVAPTGFNTSQPEWFSYLPSAKALMDSHIALHEKLGRYWYSLGY